MSNLYKFLTNLQNDYIPQYMRSSVTFDLKWWHATLSYMHFLWGMESLSAGIPSVTEGSVPLLRLVVHC